MIDFDWIWLLFSKLSTEHGAYKTLNVGYVTNAITHTQHRGWEAKWRRHRTCRRHLLCTRTFPPCIWYWSLGHLFRSKHNAQWDLFPTYFDCWGGLAFVLQTHCWDQAAKENCLIPWNHNRIIASYLDWKTFSFPRPHFLEVKNNATTRYHREQVSEENPNWASWEPEDMTMVVN